MTTSEERTPEFQAKVCKADLLYAIRTFRPEILKALTTPDAIEIYCSLELLRDRIAGRNLQEGA